MCIYIFFLFSFFCRIRSSPICDLKYIRFAADLVGCDLCNYHGTCYLSNQDQTICECFQWYAGKHCQFNLKGTFSTTTLVAFVTTISPSVGRSLLIIIIVSLSSFSSLVVGPDRDRTDVAVAAGRVSADGLL